MSKYIIFVLTFLYLLLGAVMCNSVEKINWLDRGNQDFNNHQYEDAIVCFDKALKEDSHNADTLNSKGCALVAQGEYDDAIKCFDEALDIDPDSVVAYYNKGVALKASDHDSKAKTILSNIKNIYELHDKASTVEDLTGKTIIPLPESLEKISKAMGLIDDAKTIGDYTNSLVTGVNTIESDIETASYGRECGREDGVRKGIDDAKKGISEQDPVNKYLYTMLYYSVEDPLNDRSTYKKYYKNAYLEGYKEGNILGRGISISIRADPETITLAFQTIKLIVTASLADGTPLKDAMVIFSIEDDSSKLCSFGTAPIPSKTLTVEGLVIPSELKSGYTDDNGKFECEYKYKQMMPSSAFCGSIRFGAKVAKHGIEGSGHIVVPLGEQKIIVSVESDHQHIPMQTTSFFVKTTTTRFFDKQPIEGADVEITAINLGGLITPASTTGKTDKNGKFGAYFTHNPSNQGTKGTYSISITAKATKDSIEATSSCIVWVDDQLDQRSPERTTHSGTDIPALDVPARDIPGNEYFHVPAAHIPAIHIPAVHLPF